MTTTDLPTDDSPEVPQKMPWPALSLLAFMSFLLIAGETMPAGLLPVIAQGMGTTEAVVGQYISVWALGTVVVTVPAIGLTRRMDRKPLLLCAITVLILANSVTALSADVSLALGSRFVGGAATGVIWGMLAVYGRSISPPTRGGAAISMVAIGTPLGFALGTPLGSWVGTTVDWRWSFGGVSLLALATVAAIALLVPNVAGQREQAHNLPIRRVFVTRGVPMVLAVIAVWMLAHNTIYTYIAPFLRGTGTGLRPDLVLLVYGLAAFAGVGVTAIFVDRHPRLLLHASVAGFVVAALLLVVGSGSAPVVLAAAVLWGATFGGGPTQLQAALTRAGKENADVANSFLPVAFNIAIFGAGTLGAVLVDQFSAAILSIFMAVLGGVALVLTFVGRRSAFLPAEVRESNVVTVHQA